VVHGVARWRACDLIIRVYGKFALSSDDTIYRLRAALAVPDPPDASEEGEPMVYSPIFFNRLGCAICG
jgi:hypothetical protein